MAAGPRASVSGSASLLVLRAGAWLRIAAPPRVAQTSPTLRPPPPLSPPGCGIRSQMLGLIRTAPGAEQDARGAGRGEGGGEGRGGGGALRGAGRDARGRCRGGAGWGEGGAELGAGVELPHVGGRALDQQLPPPLQPLLHSRPDPISAPWRPASLTPKPENSTLAVAASRRSHARPVPVGCARPPQVPPVRVLTLTVGRAGLLALVVPRARAPRFPATPLRLPRDPASS